MSLIPGRPQYVPILKIEKAYWYDDFDLLQTKLKIATTQNGFWPIKK